jgi:NADH-quinone oxidoreductase subunit F
MFKRILDGGGTNDDLDYVAKICSNMAGQTICAFADAVTGPALSSVKKFRSEFEDLIRNGGLHPKKGEAHSHAKEGAHV